MKKTLVHFWKNLRHNWFTREEMLCWVPPVIVGTLLRFWSLFFGLPNAFRPDEDMVVLPSLGMVGGDLDPHDYTYPTLYKYILAFVFRICMMLGLGAQEAVNAWQYAAYGFFVDGTFFFEVARVVTALLGVVTVVAVYRIGREGYGRFAGGAAAWFLAVSVLHVRDSHFGVTDVPSVAFLMLGVLWCVRIAQRGDLRDYVWSGVWVGLATSTKYGSVLGLIPLGVAHLVRRPDGVPVLSRWIWHRSMWLGVLAFVLAFVVMSPYVVWKADDFALYFWAQMRHVFEHGHGVDLGPGWLYHPRVTLRYGVGVLVLLGTLGGLVLSGLRRRGMDWVLLSLFVAFFVVTGRGKAVFFRYALPLIPLCGVFAGVFVDWVRRLRVARGGSVSAMGVVLVFLSVLEPIGASVRLNVLLEKQDTRVQAREWIESHLHEGLLIANVGGSYGDVPLQNRRGVPWWLWRYMRAFPEVEPTALADFLSQFEADLPPPFVYHFDVDVQTHGDTALLDDPEISIVITHEHPLHYSTVAQTFLNALQMRATLRAEFKPGDAIDLDRAVFDLQDAFYYPLGRFGDLERGGPVVRIWDLKDRAYSVYTDPRDQRKLLRDAFLGIGLTMRKTHRFQDAGLYFQRALRLDPGFEEAAFQLQQIEDLLEEK